MTNMPSRVEPNRPGLDPLLAFLKPPEMQMPAKQQPAAAYSLAKDDFYQLLICSSAADTTITIPLMAAQDWPINGLVGFLRGGSGALSIVPAAGVTIESGIGAAAALPYRVASADGALWLMRADVAKWFIAGDMARV